MLTSSEPFSKWCDKLKYKKFIWLAKSQFKSIKLRCHWGASLIVFVFVTTPKNNLIVDKDLYVFNLLFQLREPIIYLYNTFRLLIITFMFASQYWQCQTYTHIEKFIEIICVCAKTTKKWIILNFHFSNILQDHKKTVCKQLFIWTVK